MENYALFVLKRKQQELLEDMQRQGVGEGNYDFRPRYFDELVNAIHLLLKQYENECK